MLTIATRYLHLTLRVVFDLITGYYHLVKLTHKTDYHTLPYFFTSLQLRFHFSPPYSKSQSIISIYCLYSLSFYFFFNSFQSGLYLHYFSASAVVEVISYLLMSKSLGNSQLSSFSLLKDIATSSFLKHCLRLFSGILCLGWSQKAKT